MFCTKLRPYFLLFAAGCVPSDQSLVSVDTNSPWLVRTDFSDDATWKRICAEASAPSPRFGFRAYVRQVDDSDFAGLSAAEVVRRLPDDYPSFQCYIVDTETIESSEHLIQVIDFAPQGEDVQAFSRSPRDAPEADVKSFRVIPAAIWAVENNLSLANAEWEEFVSALDDDGVYREIDD